MGVDAWALLVAIVSLLLSGYAVWSSRKDKRSLVVQVNRWTPSTGRDREGNNNPETLHFSISTSHPVTVKSVTLLDAKTKRVIEEVRPRLRFQGATFPLQLPWVVDAAATIHPTLFIRGTPALNKRASSVRVRVVTSTGDKYRSEAFDLPT